MTLLRTVARPMLASMFLVGGASSLRHASAVAPRAQAASDLLQPLAPGAPLGPANLVRINAAVHLVAGSSLATGRFPRLSAAVLAATLVPTTLAGHRFWNESDPGARQNQYIHFVKNVTMAGGLLMATLDPDPHKPALPRRAKAKVVAAAEAVAPHRS